MRGPLPGPQELPDVFAAASSSGGTARALRVTAAWPLVLRGPGCGNHPGGRFPKGRHIQGLALAGFLPGGMNFIQHSNPPGSDRRAGRLWPQGPQHYRPGPPQRRPRLAFARHPGRSRLRPFGLPAAAAKAMISPAADPFFGEPWTSPLGRKDSKIMLRGLGSDAASFQGPWENMQPPTLR